MAGEHYNTFSPLRQRIVSEEDKWQHFDAVITGELRLLPQDHYRTIGAVKQRCKSAIIDVIEKQGNNLSIAQIRYLIRNILLELVTEESNAMVYTNKCQVLREYICTTCSMTPEKAFATIDHEWFKEHKMTTMLRAFFNNNPYEALLALFKTEIELPYKRPHLPQGFWQDGQGYERALDAMKWFKEYYALHETKDVENITSEHFQKVGLGGMLQKHFHDSPFLALKTILPALQPWEMKVAPMGAYTSLEGRVIALTSFLIEKNIGSIIGLTPEEVYEKGLRTTVGKEKLEAFGLRGLLAKYNNSIHAMFHDTFPKQMLPWTLVNGIYHAKDPFAFASSAIRWLFLDYLHIDKASIPEYATDRNFRHLGFSGILTSRKLGLNSSSYAAVELAFPGEFSKESFHRTRQTIQLTQNKSLQRNTKKI